MIDRLELAGLKVALWTAAVGVASAAQESIATALGDDGEAVIQHLAKMLIWVSLAMACSLLRSLGDPKAYETLGKSAFRRLCIAGFVGFVVGSLLVDRNWSVAVKSVVVALSGAFADTVFLGAGDLVKAVMEGLRDYWKRKAAADGLIGPKDPPPSGTPPAPPNI